MKRTLCVALCLFLCGSFGFSAFAEDTDLRFKKLEDTVQEQQKEIEALKKDERDNQNNTQQAKESTGWKVSGLFGASALTNQNISMVLDTFV